MAKLHVLTLPDHRLRIKAKPVELVNDNIRQMLDDMVDTMYGEDGIGLAATQVDIHKRMVVVDLREPISAEEDVAGFSTLWKFINPEITWKSEETSIMQEGCLSVPEHRADVTRAANIRLSYLNEWGEPRELKASGLLATCIQHEIDHLNGKLFVDYLPPMRREMVLKKLAKLKKA